MMPIDSAWLVSYSTSIDTIIISVTVFKIFDVKLSLPSTRVQGHPGANQKPIVGFLSDFL